MKTTARADVKTDLRRQFAVKMAQLWPHLLAASNAVDGPKPAEALAHLLGARAALTEAINAIETGRTA